ncbi:UDP-2,3-diacylglucosamine diphosphatase [Halobacteriovorax sp. HLS]|uniref:UDP-2,3-diacylglucosamine diphosphatase n=1 Tax=Halobacteriovorax sp. HLS TaxID=2234000 RepID=UPI000FDB63B0|nr:UDP-2,3-diacylglucosamine diphosphatase [Halobacteriovorax sp. HLS]
MKISSISDVHVKVLDDNSFKILSSFFAQEIVQKSDYIVLNGDIFDLLLGTKSQYIDKYESFFKLIEKATSMGATVVYLEGNHDFFLDRMISSSYERFNIPRDKFIHCRSEYRIEVDGEILLFTHGDDVEIDNIAYQKYKSRVNNKLMKFITRNILPFSLIEWIGQKSSDYSRSKNSKHYEMSSEGQEFVKDKFRQSAQKFFNDNRDVKGLICGHSHSKDLYKLDHGKYYINNGYAPSSKSFIYIDEQGPRFIDLNLGHVL